MSLSEPFYLWRPHPWHGLTAGADMPEVVNAYIEMTPFDSVKYEVDKETGYLRVDRPQLTSSMPPSLYGFIPRTYCGKDVGRLSPEADQADGDPLDICVLTERPINRGEVILRARVIGGLKMIDSGEADDKIIAVLDNDPFWRETERIHQLPKPLLSRLRHYFVTYKRVPEEQPTVTVEEVYCRDHAYDVIQAAGRDYRCVQEGLKGACATEFLPLVH